MGNNQPSLYYEASRRNASTFSVPETKNMIAVTIYPDYSGMGEPKQLFYDPRPQVRNVDIIGR
jgi:hypothetical protein